MIFNVIDWISRHRKFSRRDDFSRLAFVAMNKAAEADGFKYSANYLVTFFSEVFQGSDSVAYTFNPYDRAIIDSNRRSVDILLCSAGSRNSENYIDEWRSHMRGTKAADLVLPDNCVGDFGLTPIDADGRAISNPSFLELLKSNIDPYPQFRHIRHIKDNRRMTLIFPVSTSSQTRSRNSIDYRITGKEMVTRAVLRSGIADVCILSRVLAENLERAISGYLLDRISARQSNCGALRICSAISFADNQEHTIRIHDPHGRVDQTRCRIDPTLQPPLDPFSEIPEIIISELLDEDAGYDWVKGIGDFEFNIDGSPYRFSVNKEVRRPGQWALITAQLVRRYVDEVFSESTGQSQLAVWDMGCGCGIIGILAGALSQNKIGKLFFSDIDHKAVECTKRNLSQYNNLPATIVKQGDLFAVCNSDDGPFDVIAFNSPFSPKTPSAFVSTDSGGSKGRDIAERYCRELHNYLAVGGWGIMAIADYVDDGRFKVILESQFGEENVHIKDRVILYPYKTKAPIPPAREIVTKADIQKNCDYHFEDFSWR
jgi:methylase of polypeptide subunit release factors